jgi:hypothetical protein
MDKNNYNNKEYKEWCIRVKKLNQAQTFLDKGIQFFVSNKSSKLN